MNINEKANLMKGYLASAKRAANDALVELDRQSSIINFCADDIGDIEHLTNETPDLETINVKLEYNTQELWEQASAILDTIKEAQRKWAFVACLVENYIDAYIASEGSIGFVEWVIYIVETDKLRQMEAS